MSYSLIGITSLILLFILNFDVLFLRKHWSFRGVKEYRIFIYSVAMFYISDILWGFFDQAGWSAGCYIDTVVYFIAMSLSVLALTRFVIKYTEEEKTIGKRIFLYLGIALFAVAAILVTVNFFVPVLFAYDANQYVPALGRFIFLFAQIAMFLAVAIYAFVRRGKAKEEYKVNHIIIIAFSFIFVAAISFQILFPLQPFYGIGCAIGTTVIRVYLLAAEQNEYKISLEKAEYSRSKKQKELESAKQLAYTDPLTGARSKHAYVENEERLDALIRDDEAGEFSIIVFDLNDLKLINDTKGHDAGDFYLIKAANLIRQFFPDSPLYRFGGDEFTVFLTGEPFEKRRETLAAFDEASAKNAGTDNPVIATGMSDYRRGVDNSLRSVFLRADEAMYSRKRKLKHAAGGKSGSRSSIYEAFIHNKEFSLIEMLNNLSCDQIIEVDLKLNVFRQLYHTEGKYIAPPAGLTYEQLFQYCCENLVHPDDREEYAKLLDPDRFFQRLSKSRIPNFDFVQARFLLQNGQYRYVEQCVIAGEENDIAPGTFRIYVLDINNLKLRMSGMDHADTVIASERDKMTGLLTEDSFFRKAEEMVRENPQTHWCFISIDIEHFRFFDEWYGRDKGDELLGNIGKTLLDKEKELGGIGGYFTYDDFALVCPYNKKSISTLYENIRSLTVSFGLSVGFLPALGVARIENGVRVIDAFDHANIALGHAKKDIKNRIHYYDAKLRTNEELETRVLSEFVEGMKNDEFTFYLQPQCSISDGKIVGAEALARWVRPSGRITPPMEYIPTLEKYGFVMDLDKALWNKVCKWLRGLLDKGVNPVPVSVNVSRTDIATLDIPAIFHDLAKKYNLPHGLLKIEITESAYSDDAAVALVVEKLRKDGFMVLMDDFGAGYSSLNMLNSLVVDAIKLDGAFLRLNGDDYERGIHIIESVVNMTRNLRLPIIVEGVETKSQSDFLQGLGCRYAQGYYFYRPVPIPEFEALIAEEEHLDRRGFIINANDQFRLREFLDENVYSDSMLNNILGPVAIYTLDKDNHVDIVRYNQQFYEAVNVVGFNNRLASIEQYMPEEESKLLIDALKQAIDDKLEGASSVLRFLKPDGSILFFDIHFYHLGNQEGLDRFYGSAMNVTGVQDLKDEVKLLSSYMNQTVIFVSKIGSKWNYRVLSHSLSDVFGLNEVELEAEMNDGRFAKRAVHKEDLAELMRKAEKLSSERQDFEDEILVKAKDKKQVKIKMRFIYSNGESGNIDYVLLPTIINDDERN